jgi:chromosome partitioning protein
MIVIAIANPKGGVGKTAISFALAEGLADDYKVLLIDIDPLSTLTEAIGIYDFQSPTMGAVLDFTGSGAAHLTDAVLPYKPNIDFAPSSISLMSTMLDLVDYQGKETVLSRALSPVGEAYDICLIDCPPSLGLLSANALVAANSVLIPAKPDRIDGRGLMNFLESIDRVQRVFNPGLQVLGVVMTFFNKRLKYHQDAVDHFKELNVPLLPVRISSTIRIPEAMAQGQSLLTYTPGHRVSDSFRQLVQMLSQWFVSEKKP